MILSFEIKINKFVALKKALVITLTLFCLTYIESELIIILMAEEAKHRQLRELFR